MCGIFAVLLKESRDDSRLTLRELAFQQSGKQRHRGPEDTGVVILDEKVAMVHERLAIMARVNGRQPLASDDGNIQLVANGEIYNYLPIAKKMAATRGSYSPRGDCDVIIALYEEYGIDAVLGLKGMFAFVLYDQKKQEFLAARDPLGIIPMYKGVGADGSLWFASEMKCLVGVCESVEVFEPGTLLHGTVSKYERRRYYNPAWVTQPTERANLRTLHDHLVAAVETHLDCEVQLGALLSGGVDSSLIASIATKLMRKKDPNYRLKTFSIGLPNAPDFKYSRIVADYIGSDHTEFHFSIDEGLDCIRDMIYHLESYDTTTIRASIPMFLLARKAKSEGIKMALSGEGADEIFGGYLYFHRAPSAKEFHAETVSRVKCLHLADCLRANKSVMSWGIELRVPFLDYDFVEYSMSIRPEDRMAGGQEIPQINGQRLNGVRLRDMEKFVLRAAFTDDYLPNEVLWRQKEQFSDGVGYSWIDTIRSYASSRVSDDDFARAAQIYPINTPISKEAFYYRRVFTELFPGDSSARTVMAWIPRTDWGCSSDPSGRAQTAHIAHQ